MAPAPEAFSILDVLRAQDPAAENWVLEYSCSQRAFDLHPAGQPQPWYPGHDWQVLALGQAAALEDLAAELRGVLP